MERIDQLKKLLAELIQNKASPDLIRSIQDALERELAEVQVSNPAE